MKKKIIYLFAGTSPATRSQRQNKLLQSEGTALRAVGTNPTTQISQPNMNNGNY